MITDVHAHVLPSEAVAAARSGDVWAGIELGLTKSGLPYAEVGGHQTVFASLLHLAPIQARSERLQAMGIDRQVLSLLPPLLGYTLPARVAISRSRYVNDELAALARDSGRYVALATLALQDVRASQRELERAVLDLHMPGAMVGTHVAGRDWDDPALFPILRTATDLGALLFVHPVAPRAERDLVDAYYLRNVLGNPLETTAAAARLVLAGVLDRLPTLRVLLAHGGGYFPVAAGRMAHAYRTRGEGRCALAPTEYVGRFLYDSLTHSTAWLRYLVDTAGIERVLLGSDFPADMGSPDPVGALSGLEAAEQQIVANANPAREFDAPPVGAGQGEVN